jgi:hypothetical protein
MSDGGAADEAPGEGPAFHQVIAGARLVQRRIEDFYALEHGPDVGDFVRPGADGERETLFVRETDDALELELVLPKKPHADSLDHDAQIIEGVSHFVFVAERARVELPTTELELELQAEIDKFVVLAADAEFTLARAPDLHAVLYDDAYHLHSHGSARGHRYRLATTLAARVITRLSEAPPVEARRFLQRFYRSGQAEKIRMATAQ